MKFHPQTRAHITATLVLTKDPADADLVEVHIDEQWYPCTWAGPAVLINRNRRVYWQRAATTTDWFAGVDATAEPGDVEVTGTELETLTRVSWPDGTSIVEESSTIEVT